MVLYFVNMSYITKDLKNVSVCQLRHINIYTYIFPYQSLLSSLLGIPTHLGFNFLRIRHLI